MSTDPSTAARPVHRHRPRLVIAVVTAVAALMTAAGVTVAALPASAASLTQVTNFGTNPSNLRMYWYVPNVVAARPGLLVLNHFCTGSAAAIFGDLGRDFVAAADRYGYIIVFPEVTRSSKCFDVSSPQALKRGGGSDPVGIMSMVSYVRQRYNVDPNKITVGGFSSGAMMTNVLAAEYPDVFTAAAAFSGVPATCFATTNGSEWNSQCSGGQIVRTAQQWGDLARAMYPGYTGRYPRMQLWHGSTDSTLSYVNFGEAIKQWTNLNGVSQTPTYTDRPLSPWTRTRYGSSDDHPRVEGMSAAGYGHSLPLGGQFAKAITFLGLDNSVTPPTSAPPTSVITRPPTSAPPTTAPTSAPPTSPSTPPTTAVPTTSTAPTSQPAGSCRVESTVNAWNTGLTASVTVTNTGTSTVNGWSLAFTLPAGQSITSGWNATYAPSSGRVTATNVSYNGTLPAGGSVSIGFQATHTGNAGAATGFTLNGQSCTTG